MSFTLLSIADTPEATGAAAQNVLHLANDADPGELDLTGIDRIDLQFPKFTDGRAYSQAFLLRRRLGFQGELRATGDVLVDQLQLMQRSGFNAAVLRADQDLAIAKQQMARFGDFYQGDVPNPAPLFAEATPLPPTGTPA